MLTILIVLYDSFCTNSKVILESPTFSNYLLYHRSLCLVLAFTSFPSPALLSILLLKYGFFCSCFVTYDNLFGYNWYIYPHWYFYIVYHYHYKFNCLYYYCYYLSIIIDFSFLFTIIIWTMNYLYCYYLTSVKLPLLLLLLF